MDPIDALDFSKAGGLVTAIAQDAATGEILMVANMNEAAFRRTLETGEVVYWSRSRKKLARAWGKQPEYRRVTFLLCVRTHMAVHRC